MTESEIRAACAGTDPRPDRIGDAWDWLTLLGRATDDKLIEALRAARIMGARLEHVNGALVMRQPLDCTVADWLEFREHYLLPVAPALTAALREASA